MIQNQLGISGEPTEGIIYEDSEEGITLRYDPNTQFIIIVVSNFLRLPCPDNELYQVS